MNIGQQSPLCFDIDNSTSLRFKIGSPLQSHSNQFNLQKQKKKLFSAQNQNIIYSIIQRTKQSKISDKESFSNMRTTSLQKCFNRSKDLLKDQNFVQKSKDQLKTNNFNFIENLDQYKKAITKSNIHIESSISKNVSKMGQYQRKNMQNYRKINIQHLINKKLKFQKFQYDENAQKIGQISHLNKEVDQIWTRLQNIKKQLKKQQHTTTQSYKKVTNILRTQKQKEKKLQIK